MVSIPQISLFHHRLHLKHILNTVNKNDHPYTNSVMSIKHQLYSVNMLQPIIWSSAGGMIDPHDDYIVG